jgi:hypothetical protein
VRLRMASCIELLRDLDDDLASIFIGSPSHMLMCSGNLCRSDRFDVAVL